MEYPLNPIISLFFSFSFFLFFLEEHNQHFFFFFYFSNTILHAKKYQGQCPYASRTSLLFTRHRSQLILVKLIIIDLISYHKIDFEGQTILLFNNGGNPTTINYFINQLFIIVLISSTSQSTRNSIRKQLLENYQMQFLISY